MVAVVVLITIDDLLPQAHDLYTFLASIQALADGVAFAGRFGSYSGPIPPT